MEYVIRSGKIPVNLGLLAHRLLDLDPAILFDRDVLTGDLRCATSALAAELLLAFSRSGYHLGPEDIVLVPSVCCGGCSG
ncbi:hypothetical protein [Pseudoxanthomonas sp. PXM02]|uniref:hypothetical protein n=1 Tax=Pseudoxanthomonas sp. PXM02 TaxID=2769294 RepID=UPI0017850E98|nr:hypothetical protein [Pseudoxanthomonas sp. PXM02]MBD9481328.1 hypothetical protein [Pseudoxanthomonas sp. PXM02]